MSAASFPSAPPRRPARLLLSCALTAAVGAAVVMPPESGARLAGSPQSASAAAPSDSAAPATAPTAPVLTAAQREQDRKVDAAVDKALKYLAKNSKYDPNTRQRWWETGYGKNTAIASLCVMAFLARGHIPGEGPYGDILNEAVDFVVATQQSEGLLTLQSSHGPMYEHGISTLMLAEVLGMTAGKRNERVREALGRAVALILKAQKVNKNTRERGGWRYQPSSPDSDLSVSGWQLMAIRAAANCGVQVPKGHIDDAVEYVKNCAVRDGGFGYQPGNRPVPAMTGTGIVALEVCAKHNTDEARRGCDYLLRNVDRLRWGTYEHWFYAIYYTSQAVYQVKGNDDQARADPNNDWEKYRRKLEEIVLEKQLDDGTWPGAAGHDQAAGPAYRTAMCVLAMSVHCKYLPIYQR